MGSTLILGDCIKKLKKIPHGSVDTVICDMPYGSTDCKWDTIIPLKPLWKHLKRITKPNSAIILTASQPFTTLLIKSNIQEFKYELIWDKVNRTTGYGNISFMPLKRHENICVFVACGKPTFNPQYGQGTPYNAKRTGSIPSVYGNGGLHPKNSQNNGIRSPISIIAIKADNKTEMGIHPTQKPVALMEYLVRTYTNKGETVLDFAMGSGTTGVACKNLCRNFIGIELNKEYFKIAKKRISKRRRATLLQPQ